MGPPEAWPVSCRKPRASSGVPGSLRCFYSKWSVSAWNWDWVWVWVWVRIWVWVVRCPGAVLCVLACLAAFLADRMPVAAGSNPPCLPQSKLSSGDKIALLRTAALKDSFVLGRELQIYPENCLVSPCHAPLYGSWGQKLTVILCVCSADF